MKKILSFVLHVPLLLFLSTNLFALEDTKSVYIHYYRYQEDYENWSLWLWQSKPESLEGVSYEFVKDDTATIFNWGGVVAKINLVDDLASATELGFIVRRGDWLEKDVDLDRFFTIPEKSTDGNHHIYLVENDVRVGTALDDEDGPSRYHKFRQAYFADSKTIKFTSTEAVLESNFSLLVNGDSITYNSFESNGLTSTVTLNNELNFSNSYQVSATFSDNNTDTFNVTYDGIYDTDEFNDAYAYEGSDLGAVVKDDVTSFRLWAPVSTEVKLNLYETGTASTDPIPLEVITMTRDIKGTFFHQIDDNLHGTYYTFSVTNGGVTYEVVDPYAKSTGVNGGRGLVVDFSKTNPDGFEYGNLANNMTNETDAIIYELHVRDLTIHESWNGSEENRGKYLGLAESGTKYNGYTTGFDHIKELGVTHVQLLPFFDFGVIDETRHDDPTYENIFNWGYMPLHFNTLEGTYSSNPYDGLVRINEMKQVIAAYTEANIRINMDVVYNHSGLSADSNFNLIVPGYYHRMTESNSFSNGSGTGNEMASERFMMRKFIVESVEFWAKEYNIAGFRFDLMALHDLETMREIVKVLNDIDPTIMVYGEPWMGGTTTLPASEQAGKTNLHLLDGVGAFNDDLRDGVKGSVFVSKEGGFVQGNFNNQLTNRVKYGIAGGIKFEGLEESLLSNTRVWHTSPLKTINYVTAHDNNTLHDKLHMTLEDDNKTHLITPMIKQANAIVLTSQGVSFLHAGDEFARTKPAASGSGFDSNSYESPDSVNQIRWDQKGDHLDLFEYFKGLIKLRKSEDLFRLTSAEDILEKLEFVYENTKGLIAYTLSDDDSNYLVLHNANQKNTRVKLPKGGGWHVIVDGNTAGTESINTYKGGQRVRLDANSTYVMYQDETLPDTNNTLLIVSIIGGIVVVAGEVTSFIFIKKKKNV